MTAPDALLQPMKNRLAAATPGPWETREDDLTDDVDVVHDQEQVSFVASCGEKHMPRAYADAIFIANAPTDQAKLIAAVERVLALADSATPVRGLMGEYEGIILPSDIRKTITAALEGRTA